MEKVDWEKYPKLEDNLGFYRGKTVALSFDGKYVFCFGENADEVYDKAKKMGVFPGSSFLSHIDKKNEEYSCGYCSEQEERNGN